MRRLAILGVAALTTVGLVSVGCSSSSNNPASGAGGSTSTTGGGATGTTGGSTSASSSTGGAAATTGGSTGTPAATGGSSSAGGNTGTAGSTACGTTNGTYTENTTFATAASTAPYKLNSWGTWGSTTTPTVTQTTTGPTGIDCSAGCAVLTLDFAAGTAAYAAGLITEYFGTTDTSVENLLNETITAKVAVSITQASGATVAVPISIDWVGYDTFTDSTGVDNVWVINVGTASSLDVANGFQSKTLKVTDQGVPSWAVVRTVCASGLHSIGIRIQNSAAIDATNGATVSLYVQSIAVAP